MKKIYFSAQISCIARAFLKLKTISRLSLTFCCSPGCFLFFIEGISAPVTYTTRSKDKEMALGHRKNLQRDPPAGVFNK